jgi:Spy/CpxP family protein refolding chaperone
MVEPCAIDAAGAGRVKVSLKSAVITITLAFAAGVAGVWLGGQLLAPRLAPQNSLHAMVHEELSLTPEQEQELDAIEKAFAERRKALENEMRKANAELANAIRASDTAGPEVEAAVHHFHDAMGALQAETINHVFAMRRVLTPEQRTRFDEKLAEALTSDAQ